MSSQIGLPPGITFEEKLEALRKRIDLLPESQRSHLYELADTIHQQHVHSESLSKRESQ